MFVPTPHNQRIHFDNGQSVWIRDIVQVETAGLLHLLQEDGKAWIVNPSRVLYTEIWKGGRYGKEETPAEANAK